MLITFNSHEDGTFGFLISDILQTLVNCTHVHVNPQSVMEELAHCFPILPSGILPPMIRYMSPDRRIIIIENRPRYVTIEYVDNKMNDVEQLVKAGKKINKAVFNIPLPWTIYIVGLTSDGLPVCMIPAIVRSQIQDLKDPIFHLPVPNVYQDGHLCMAPLDSDSMQGEPSLRNAFFSSYSSLWLSGFNSDLSAVISYSVGRKSPSFIYNYFEQNPDQTLSPFKCLEVWANTPISTVLAENSWSMGSFRTIQDGISWVSGNLPDMPSTSSWFFERFKSSLLNVAEAAQVAH